MKIEHEMFAHHYILTGDKEAAYKKAYPQASGEALKIAARKLINRAEVRSFITQELETTRHKAAAKHLEEEQQRIEEEKATMLLMRKKLHDIISGETKQKKYFKFKDRVEVVEEDCSSFAVMRAIELNIKIENEWYRRHGKHMKTGERSKETRKKEDELAYRYMVGDEQTELFYGPDFVAGLRAKAVKDNPGWSEKYKRLGLKVLDHVPTHEEDDRMKQAHKQQLEEWRQAKEFIEQRENDYEAVIKEMEEGNEIIIPDLPEPKSLPAIYEQLNMSPAVSLSRHGGRSVRQTSDGGGNTRE